MQSTRILLVNPPITLGQVYGKYASGAPVLPPLGFCYVASVLLERGHNVRLLDCVAEHSTLEDVKKAIEDFKPQILGVTSTTVSFYYAKQVLSLAKSLDGEILTFLGGAHISALPKETMEECPELDFGVYGEGEITIQETLSAIEDGRPLNHVLGLCYRDDGRIIITPPRPNMKDLDVLPRPARHLLKSLALYSPNPFRGFNRAVSIISSRGCTFDCSYCDQSVFSRRWRAHSADYVVAEMRELIDSHGFDFFSFEDDHFLISRERVLKLCQKIIDSKLNVGWTCSARANSFTPEVLSRMKEAGCKTVYLGLESGSPRVLQGIDKGITLESARAGAFLLKEHGIQAYGAFMIGSPTETKEDIDMTMKFALSLPLDAISCFIYVPYPATPLRALALKKGFVSDDWRDYSAHPRRLPFLGERFTEEYLLEKQREFYRKFYLRPGYLLRHLPNYLNSKFLSRAGGMLRDYASNEFTRKTVSAGGVASCQRPRVHT